MHFVYKCSITNLIIQLKNIFLYITIIYRIVIIKQLLTISFLQCQLVDCLVSLQNTVRKESFYNSQLTNQSQLLCYWYNPRTSRPVESCPLTQLSFTLLFLSLITMYVCGRNQFIHYKADKKGELEWHDLSCISLLNFC